MIVNPPIIPIPLPILPINVIIITQLPIITPPKTNCANPTTPIGLTQLSNMGHIGSCGKVYCCKYIAGN